MFAERGVELACSGDATSRKQFERQVDGLRARGLLIVQSASGRRVGARLTDAADDWLRGVLTLPTLAESWPLLGLFDELARTEGVKTNGGFLWESALVVEPHGTREHDLAVYGNAELLLPASWRGLVDSASDSGGRIGWRLTDRGRAASQGDAPIVPTLPEWTDYWRATEDAVYAHYLAAFDAASKSRQRWERRVPNAVTIPLSAGAWTWHERTRKPKATRPRKSRTRKAG
jgi:hypothetical protein